MSKRSEVILGLVVSLEMDVMICSMAQYFDFYLKYNFASSNIYQLSALNQGTGCPFEASSSLYQSWRSS